MTKTLRWQLYVSFYTSCFGVPLLLFPNTNIPLFGFEPTQEPWIRLVGMFLLGFVLPIHHGLQKTHRRDPAARHHHAGGFTLVFFVLALSGYPPFFYLAAGIVGVGLAGSTLAYLSERRTDKPAMLKHPLGEQP